jgi:hypothetical protein
VKDTLAERVLAAVMQWEADQLARGGSELQMMARHKYDSYEGYRPGLKFLENLGGWLAHFPDLEDRAACVRFVLEDLVFVSRAELDHLITTVYPDIIRPMLIREAAERIGESRFAVQKVVESDAFRQIQRKLLVLGLSDGSRIDRLRRSSPDLSHEQIHLAADVGDETVRDSIDELRDALGEPAATFEHVLLVDDFYGSGTTLLRENPDGPEPFKGKLWRAKRRLDDLQSKFGAFSEDYRVSVLVYIASSTAEDRVERMLEAAELDWQPRIVQKLPEALKVAGADICRICEWHYDDVLVDKHKPERAPLGFGDAALPVVLFHNTPNNSISILWADTTDRPEGQNRKALFPRYERHRADRA